MIIRQISMYPAYFGLKETSFSITPDPQYLFLSQRHQEALAHLLYGTKGGGFVLLTGEVGTGKTTICRAFLEQLPDDVDVALILNPAVTATELLQSICSEFGIPTPANEQSMKILVDRLNDYLLDAHAKGRHPVLMIDEAQNLHTEVLEQIRLLTNLETPKHKLLQIFLIGQPELRDMLNQPHLRQLAQRVIARYHLTPLDSGESADYIRHRLKVAGSEQALFSKGAIKKIYHLSGGIPRLINILCDRSLLGAYATQSRQIDKRIVTKAAHEVLGMAPERTELGLIGKLARASAFALACMAAGWVGLAWLDGTTPEKLIDKRAEEPAPSANTLAQREKSTTETHKASKPPKTDPPTQTAAALKPLWADISSSSLLGGLADKNTAMAILLRRWKIDSPSNSGADPCELAHSNGLACRSGKSDLDTLRQYDRPAMLHLKQAIGDTQYAVLTELNRTQATLDDGQKQHRVSLKKLKNFWSGDFVILWKTATGGETLIGPHSSATGLQWLGETLAATGNLPSHLGTSVSYAQLRSAIINFQIREGLDTDGIAGPETLIRLHNALNPPDIPHLRGER